MSPTSNESAGPDLNLPAPVTERSPEAQPDGAAPQAEQAPAASERSPQASQVPAAPPTWPAMPAMPVTDDSSTSDSNDVTNTSRSVMPKVLEDKDLIDKAVVEKAKAIVSRTRENPYQQTQELTGLKVEFMQQNYNKAIKLSQ